MYFLYILWKPQNSLKHVITLNYFFRNHTLCDFSTPKSNPIFGQKSSSQKLKKGKINEGHNDAK